MEELKEILFKMNELLYLKPVTAVITIEGLGDRTFTSINEIASEEFISEGQLDVYALYKTHTAILTVDLYTMEVSDPRLVYRDSEAVKIESEEMTEENNHTTKTTYNG